MQKLKKATKKQITELKPYWKAANQINQRYWEEITRLEEAMLKKFKIDYEIFHCDGDMVGIGNYSRTIKLIYKEELE
jgi:hypothetical protein